MKQYRIYVADDNGWFEECPNFKAVFFGDAANDGEYVAHTYRGELLVSGFRAAKRVLRSLGTSGDWTTPDGEIKRPTYAMEAVGAVVGEMKNVYERRIGTRRIYGTDWPVDAVAWKAGEKKWFSAVICNCISEQGEQHRTKAAAIERAESLSDKVKE